MLINFVDATNNANHYTKPPPYLITLYYLIYRQSQRFPKASKTNREWLEEK